MANRTQQQSKVRAAANQPPERRQGLGAGDVLVFGAMATAAIAAGVGLHLQANLSTMAAGAMASGLFVLIAYLHVQRLRISRLRIPERPLVRQEPALVAVAVDDSTLELASSQLAAASAALRESDKPAYRRQRSEVARLTEDTQVSWGEAADVDAMVRQYAKDLDRVPAPVAANRAEFGGAPRPNMPRPNPPAIEAPAETACSEAVRKAANGDVDIHLQPIVAFSDRKARLYEVFPRIIDAAGGMLAPHEYAADAEALGLTFAIERANIMRCCSIQRNLSEKGRARSMILRLSGAAIRDRSFLQRLLADINPDPLLTDLIVFEIDQSEIEHGDGVERENMEFLANAGFRFSLGSADTLALEVEELTLRRIMFVRVTPSVLSGEHNPTAVSDLRKGGIETILTAMVREEDIRVARAFGLVLGQGALFSDPKPLRPDVAAAGSEAEPPRRLGRRANAA